MRTPSLDDESVSLLKTMDSAAYLAAILAALTLVVGGWIGVRTAVTTHPALDRFDHVVQENTQLGIGSAIVLLSLVVALLAALASWVLFGYAQPRLKALEEQKRRALEQAQLEGGW